MAKHVRIPGFIPLHKYMSRPALETLEQITWLGSSQESPMYKALRAHLPTEDHLEALDELALIAQEARKRADNG